MRENPHPFEAYYIITLHGTNPPNGKAAEGVKWIEPAEEKQSLTKGS